MSRIKVEGQCAICGRIGVLSYEHIPPEAAFNDRRILEADIKEAIERGLAKSPDNLKGKIKQRGAGNYTLCGQCNSQTGHWYGGAYVDFVQSVYCIPEVSPCFSRLEISILCKPQNILKQIVAMFCSACGPDFAQKNASVSRYLLNREETYFLPSLSIYLAFFDKKNSGAARQSGLSALLNLDAGESKAYAEISFPPFNIIMTVDSGSPDARLFDITWFQRYKYNEKALVSLELWNLPVNNYLPCDYRMRS